MTVGSLLPLSVTQPAATGQTRDGSSLAAPMPSARSGLHCQKRQQAADSHRCLAAQLIDS